MGIHETVKQRQQVVRCAPRAATVEKHEFHAAQQQQQQHYNNLLEPQPLVPISTECETENFGLDANILEDFMLSESILDSNFDFDNFSSFDLFSSGFGSSGSVRSSETAHHSTHHSPSDSPYSLSSDSASEFDLEFKPNPMQLLFTSHSSNKSSRPFGMSSQQHEVKQATVNNSQESDVWSVRFNTSFHPNYYRNDRKHLQCFPACIEFGEYSLGRLENKKHSIKKRSNCLGDVVVHVDHPSSWSAGEESDCSVVVLGHIKSLYSSSKDADSYPVGKQFTKIEMDSFASTHCYMRAAVDRKAVEGGGEKKIQATFVPKGNWKCEERLDTKEKNKSLFVFCFETVVFALDSQTEKFVLVARESSSSFELAHTRKLARLAKRIGIEASCSDDNGNPAKKHCRH